MRKLQMVSKSAVKNLIKEVFDGVRDDLDDNTFTPKELKKYIKDTEKHILSEITDFE